MPTQRYEVTQPHIETLLAWVTSGEIAIPEIQRPFVWQATDVRDFLDSLLRGFPVGYLIAWRNPDVKLKDGTKSAGKRILIDGQQRVTAMMAALLGRQVVNKSYQSVRIKIAFHPSERRFEVSNPALEKSPAWIPDVAVLFDPHFSQFDFVRGYCAANPGVSEEDIFRSLQALLGIKANQIGLIELSGELDIETVTLIFIRVNSQGVPLSQADFAMSKIAVNESYGGNMLRKAIDYFCHMAVAPDFHKNATEDRAFAASEYLQPMIWLRRENDDLYDPSYVDLLRVAFTSEFRRGEMKDLVALLSGRNFETKQYEEAIVEDSFRRLKSGVLRFMNENHFKSFLLIVRSAGFVDASMIGSQNALNFAYILYLTLRQLGVPTNAIERHVRRWLVMSLLTGRYTGSPESTFDRDIRQIDARGFDDYAAEVYSGELSEAFWSAALPQEMDTSVASSPYFRVFQAAQVVLGDTGFLSTHITVKDLLEVKSDVHHVFARAYLKGKGLPRSQYNQIANYVVAQSEINIAIGSKRPSAYFTELLEQCQGGRQRYGNIIDPDELRENLRMHCIPDGIERMTVDDYPAFLAERRKLMAQRIKTYFGGL